MHLNAPRHVKTITPCLQEIHKKIFDTPLAQYVGPYCCAQFIVGIVGGEMSKIGKKGRYVTGIVFQKMAKIVHFQEKNDILRSAVCLWIIS